MKTNRLRSFYLLPAAVVILSAAIFTGAQSSKQRAAAISYARSYRVSRIEPGLPNQRFDVWWKKLIGSTPIKWTAGECDKLTSFYADLSFSPHSLCVEAESETEASAIRVLLRVGTFGKRFTRAKPTVELIRLDAEGEEHMIVETLSEAKKKIREFYGIQPLF